MENEKINIGIISNVKAAQLAGITKQGIYDLKKKGHWDFFTEKGKVNTGHPQWEKYINRKIKQTVAKELREQYKDDFLEQEKPSNHENDEPIIIPKKQINVTIGTESGVVKPEQNKINVNRESDEQANMLTGGVNAETLPVFDVDEILKKTKIRELELKMEVMLGTLVKRDMVVSSIEAFNQATSSHFIDLPRKVSSLICQKLNCVGQEKVIELIMQPLIEKGIQDVKKKAMDAIEVELDVK